MSTIETLFSYSYTSNPFTTNLDPAQFGTSLGGFVIFNFDAFVATGTFGPDTWINPFLMDRFGAGNLGWVIDPSSFLTLEHGHVTDWSITATGGSPNGTNPLVFMSTTPTRDLIQMCPTCPEYASVENSPGAWTFTDSRVPAPEVGAGLLPLLLLLAFLTKRGVTK